MSLSFLRKKYIGEVLLSKKYINREQLQEALEESVKQGKKIGQVLLSKGYISEEMLFECLSLSIGVEYLDLKTTEISKDVLQSLSENYARKYLAVPFKANTEVIWMAMADPTNFMYREELSKITGKKVSVALSSEKEILSFIERFYVRTSLSGEIDEKEVEEVGTSNGDYEEQNNASEDNASAPVIKYVNSIFFDAITNKASDIHLEPFEKEVSLRMRIDGVLQPMTPPSKKYYSAIVSRIKIMSELNIAERRLPQDGKCRVKVANQVIDVRVSIIPTIWGEKIVLRILAKNLFGLDIERVGFSKKELESFKEAIGAPYGMILITGPTSSGKTTTIYSALGTINRSDLNIMTAEDPVEYEIKGINQVHVRTDIGLSFANILRSFMRQDPDVILVGEIRDKETAQIAIQSALTGHLVFSTLHTNDTISTISRMSFMGIEAYLLADAVNMIIAQRLVRVICSNCKQELNNVPESIYNRLGIEKNNKLYVGKGCSFCGETGYKGRIAIFEMLNVTKEIRACIADKASEVELRKVAKEQGLVTLRQSAVNKLLEGVTTLEEVFNVVSIVER